MNIIWLGHGSFRIEAASQTILIDPWLAGNPVFPDDRRAEALTDVSHIFVTHGHFDHASELHDIATETGATIAAVPELTAPFADAGLPCIGFNKGGTVQVGEISVSMVPASHASSLATQNGVIYAGTEAGFVLRAEGHCAYFSGDTGITADMDWIGDFYKPDIGILCAGGHYTMGMEEAAYAARRYFNFSTVIPCHYGTFPALAQSARPLIDALPEINVIEPEILKPIRFAHAKTVSR